MEELHQRLAERLGKEERDWVLELIDEKDRERPVSYTHLDVYKRQKVDGAKRSQHLYAAAADIKVSGMSASEVYRLCDRLVGNRGVAKTPGEFYPQH